MTLRNVEMRYYGQKDVEPGIKINGSTNVTIEEVAMNRGYHHAVSIANSDSVNIKGCVIYRSHLPAVNVLNQCRLISITNNLGVVSIFPITHRGNPSPQVLLA